MMRKKSLPHIVCFGEVLWDETPEGKTPGGAPMNVAAHLQSMGVKTSLISRLGTDSAGRELERYLLEKGIDTQFIQHDSHQKTCLVTANTTDKQNVKYVFDTPTAWDFIEVTQENLLAVQHADAFVFGSLASRDLHSRQSLTTFMEASRLNIFDVNLRPPFYEKGFLEQTLRKAHLVKLNNEELSVICDWYAFSGTEEEKLYFFKQTFRAETVCLTLGEKGAWLLENGQLYKQEGFRVKVEDTIGAGDAFLAAYITKWFEGKSPFERLQFACAVGAVVATFKGANPVIYRADIEQLIRK